MSDAHVSRDAAIRTDRLTKRFGRRVALDRLDLEVARGTVFGYLGPNGAGKTTTIRLLTGLYRPTSGTARVLGVDVGTDADRVQARLGYLPSDFVGYPDLTGRRFLELLGSLRGGVPESATTSLAARLDVDLTRRIGTLSHGNRQKLGLIQAFMHRPDLVVLDEPTQGLDPLVQRVFLDLVREHRDGGGTVFLSSHVLSEVEAVADEVGILAGGRLVAVRTMEALRAEAVSRVDLRFEADVPLQAIRAVPGTEVVEAGARAVRLAVTGPMTELFRAVAPYGVQDVRTHEADLVEAFLSYYPEKGDGSDDDRAQGALGPASQSARVG